MRLSFGDLLDGKKPIFVEVCGDVGTVLPELTMYSQGVREIYGEHTCDMRRSKVSKTMSDGLKLELIRSLLP